MSCSLTYALCLLTMTVWREARGESFAAKQAVAFSIANRVARPRWWGRDWVSVITKPEQYSSMTHKGDPNTIEFAASDSDPVYLDCLTAATQAFTNAVPDPTHGATHYFDKSLDAHPPNWTTAPDSEYVMDVGNFHFWRCN